MFKYPIGVQLFNRPQYARRVLQSIQNQSLDFDEQSISIYIDGFEGSVYQRRNEADFTDDVEAIAREFFPNSEIIRFRSNCGIADLHNRLQTSVFARTAEWAAFFEEDVVLEPMYFKELGELIKVTEDFDSIVKVGCFQIIDSMSHLPRGLNGFYPGTGTKAFAERKSFFLAKQPIIAKFVDIERIPGDNSDNSIRCSNLAAAGYFLPYFQKDSLVESFLHLEEKFHVVTKPNIATDIGFEGVHNYTTSPLKVSQKENSTAISILERRRELEESFDQIVNESKQHIIQNYKDVLQGYHTSTSRKSMLYKILIMTFRKGR
jgi:hypothetical protein